MKSKSIISMIIMITLLTIFTAGCADTTEEEPSATATPSPAPTLEPTIESTTEPTIEPTEAPSPTPEEEIEVPNIARVQSYLIIPQGGMQINAGETITFRNFDNLRRTFVLVSEENLWGEDQQLNYMRTVDYTFTEPGTYTFYIRPAVNKKWVVTVV